MCQLFGCLVFNDRFHVSFMSVWSKRMCFISIYSPSVALTLWIFRLYGSYFFSFSFLENGGGVSSHRYELTVERSERARERKRESEGKEEKWERVEDGELEF